MITEILYRCDPEKNKECKKTACALVKKKGRKTGDCCVTIRPECAVLDDAERPVVAYVVMRGEDNGTD